jgi:glutathione gamma-glutamylcysteinyltransferase
MSETLYRRPLPGDAIAFASPAGRQLFAEALAGGGLDGYFLLAEQFHTQSEPAFCGLGSLVVALNALAIDPGRLWKGPWRWFSEELLDCCVSLDEIRRRGLDLDELACLARCNGADVELHRADAENLAAWRDALALAARGEAVVIASYDRGALDQTGTGHFSPIGGYHAARDLALVLDVARFKYPPHWESAQRLWSAMQPVDPATGRSRGWMTLKRRAVGVALGFSLRCDGEGWQGLASRLERTIDALGPVSDLAELARAVAPLTSSLSMRTPTTAAHQDGLVAAQAAVRELAVFPVVEAAVGANRAIAVTILLLAIADRLSPALQAELASGADPALAAELSNLRAQLSAVLTIASRGSACRP